MASYEPDFDYVIHLRNWYISRTGAPELPIDLCCQLLRHFERGHCVAIFHHPPDAEVEVDVTLTVLNLPTK
jgi:hypothetical protein